MNPVPLDDFAERINELLPDIIKEFVRRQTNILYKGKITVPQSLVLDHVLRQGQTKMSALAQMMGVTTAATTGIVDRLVREGYLKRSFQPEDRRIVNITLTSRGATMVKKIIEERRSLIMEIFGSISESDRADYLRILMRIRAILTRE